MNLMIVWNGKDLIGLILLGLLMLTLLGVYLYSSISAYFGKRRRKRSLITSKMRHTFRQCKVMERIQKRIADEAREVAIKRTENGNVIFCSLKLLPLKFRGRTRHIILMEKEIIENYPWELMVRNNGYTSALMRIAFDTDCIIVVHTMQQAENSKRHFIEYFVDQKVKKYKFNWFQRVLIKIGL